MHKQAILAPTTILLLFFIISFSLFEGETFATSREKSLFLEIRIFIWTLPHIKYGGLQVLTLGSLSFICFKIGM